MSPIIRTRAQNRRKSGVPPPLTPPGEALQPPATRPSKIKKPARRRTFKIEVLTDRTSEILNVAQQKKRRRMTSFHPEIAPLAIEVTPVDELKKAPSMQTRTHEKRRHRSARTSLRASLHVHWAKNLRRVAPISPSPNMAVVQHGQVRPYMRPADVSFTHWMDLTGVSKGEQSGGQPRSILRVFRDEQLASPPTNLPPDGTSAGALSGTPLYALPEIPRSITLRRRVREPRAGLQPCSSRSQMLSIDDSPSDLGSATREGSSSTQVHPSGSRQATRTSGTISSGVHGRATVSGPPTVAKSPVSIGRTRTNARRVFSSTSDYAPAPAPLPTETPVLRREGWIKLPENRIDRCIMIFYLVYTPIILPLVLRVLGLV